MHAGRFRDLYPTHVELLISHPRLLCWEPLLLLWTQRGLLWFACRRDVLKSETHSTWSRGVVFVQQ